MADIRATILDADDLGRETLHVPEWGVDIEVRGMTGRDRSALQRQIANQKDGINLETWYAEIVLASVYDPGTGKRVFEPADRQVIVDKSAAALERIVDVATRLSGMRPEAVEQAKQELGEAST